MLQSTRPTSRYQNDKTQAILGNRYGRGQSPESTDIIRTGGKLRAVSTPRLSEIHEGLVPYSAHAYIDHRRLSEYHSLHVQRMCEFNRHWGKNEVNPDNPFLFARVRELSGSTAAPSPTKAGLSVNSISQSDELVYLCFQPMTCSCAWNTFCIFVAG